MYFDCVANSYHKKGKTKDVLMLVRDDLRKIKPTIDQEEALNKIEDFLGSDKDVFILKGYAGTGKTTLLEGLIKYLGQDDKQVDVFAPTGRAAKILRDKTNRGSTIHRGIYNLEEFETINDESEDDAEKSYHYHFPILKNVKGGQICIVDEASMVSDKESKHELFTFGTDRLLNDLLTYMRFPNSDNKLILVGDPAQLEPVTDSESKALMESYFQDKDLQVESYVLKEVVRQEENSTLLKNATNFRNLLKKNNRNEVSLEYGNDVLKLSPVEITRQYLNEFPNPKVGDGVIINFSNRRCLAYNQAVRSKLFPKKKNITEGDILIINKNNYKSHEIDLYNGTMVEVLWASTEVETQKAPVYVKEGGEKVRKIISLDFRDVQIRIPDHDLVIKCKIIDTLLNSPFRGLSVPEMKALYINFIIRFNEQQNKREEQGLPKIKEGSHEFKELIENDPYFNALHVKYGYSITCHKAQGGEWDTAFVNFQDQIGLKDSHLRWCYTAMTRASNKMYAINPPEITPLGSLKFTSVKSLGKLPADAIQFRNIPETPYHSSNAHPAKKQKFFEIEEKFSSTPYLINRVESRDYMEMYFVDYKKDTIRLDANHNKAGIFSNFVAQSNSEGAEKLEKLVNRSVNKELIIDYDPLNEAFEKLFSAIQSSCNDLNIPITNVIEEKDKYFVLYYFEIGEAFAAIQFYFNKNFQITRGIPKMESASDLEKKKFQKLIEKLS